MYVTYRRDGTPIDKRVRRRIDERGRHVAQTRSFERWLSPDANVELGCSNARTSCGDVALCEETGTAVATAARIFNCDELTESLSLRSAVKPTKVAELVLAAYLRWGESCVAKFHGDFAIAIWDSRQRTLICARDPLGVMPLYFVAGRDAFYASTGIDLLLASPTVSHDIDRRRVGDFLCGIARDPVSTFYAAVSRLRAGHLIAVSPAELKDQRYWFFDVGKYSTHRTIQESSEAIRDHLLTAVNQRVGISSRPAVALSGGLDSSSVAAAVDRSSERPPLAFSFIFPDLPDDLLPGIDERRYIDSVRTKYNMPWQPVHGDQTSPLVDLSRRLATANGPQIGISAYLHWRAFGLARDRGVDTWFDGFGGDEAVSNGTERLMALAQSWRFLALYNEIRALRRRSRSHIRVGRTMVNFGIKPAVPAWLRGAYRQISPHSNTPAALPEFLSAAFAEELRDLMAGDEDPPFHGDPHQLHLDDLLSDLTSQCLEIAYASALAFDLQVVYPFLDARFVQCALRVPIEFRLRDGWTRYCFREAMNGLLPEEVRWRPTKADLSANFRWRLAKTDKETVLNVLEGHPQWVQDYVDVASVRHAFRQVQEDGACPSRTALGVFSTTALGYWVAQHESAC